MKRKWKKKLNDILIYPDFLPKRVASIVKEREKEGAKEREREGASKGI